MSGGMTCTNMSFELLKKKVYLLYFICISTLPGMYVCHMSARCPRKPGHLSCRVDTRTHIEALCKVTNALSD